MQISSFGERPVDLSDALAHVPGSTAHMERARRVIPRGMSSRGRLRAVPVAFDRGKGAHLFDVDGNEYVDLVMALGPMLLGHNPEAVIEAATRQLGKGLQFGGQSLGEVELAERIVQHVPSAEKVLLTNTGSEAVQSAVRIAKGATGRRVILKFEGHYHGWIDPFFVNSPGVPAAGEQHGLIPVVHNIAGQPTSTDVLVIAWNDVAEFDSVMAERGDDIAAVIMEPIPFNFGTMHAAPGYLDHVAAETRRHGALLIFDEVVSGFRIGLGGAQELLGVTPDLTTFAKAIAAGFPLAAVAGTEAAMECVTSGPVTHGGTYNGLPFAVAAAIANLDYLSENAQVLYPRLEARGAQLADGLRRVADKHGIPVVVNQIGSVLQAFWEPQMPVENYADAAESKAGPIAAINELVLAEGVHAAPRGIKFLSTEHTVEDLERVISAYDTAVGRYLG
ncbi:aspartate aminotransferase family protein [Nocardioides sp. NPDC006303]|uniref:aspartate aminotransferase family protein n=1 Tax=Nocardioides sp. NPDC006303 TaxID=3156747 RepID=UPI0033AF7DD3